MDQYDVTEGRSLDWIGHWAREADSQTAVKDVDASKALTYGQLDHAARQIGHVLHQKGLEKGARIALMGANQWLYAALFSAAQKWGFILVPVNFRLAAAEVDYILQDAKPSLLVCADAYTPLLPEGQKFISWDELETTVDFEQPPPDRVEASGPGIDDPLFILYTSGTTGHPKGVLYTHRMLLWNSINTHLRLDITSSDITVNVMPPFHTGGWNVLPTPFWHHGATVVQMAKFEPDRLLKTLEQEKATLFMGVPTMLRMMADDPTFDEVGLRALRYIIAGGESMPIPLIEKWDQKGVPIRQGYGMTEVGPNLTSLHQRDAYRKRGSIGTPNLYLQVKLVDERGEEVPTGDRGELLLKGPVVTPGYWQNEHATQKAFNASGWYQTGDILIQDEEGYLYVVDRKKNMFISGGENVYPAEVERVLLGFSGVLEAVVVPYAHSVWGEAGFAFVTGAQDAPIDLNALEAHCKGVLARFKVPKQFQQLSSLPKNDSGKFDRRLLTEEAQKQTTTSSP